LCQAHDKKKSPANVGCEGSPSHFHAQTGYSMNLKEGQNKRSYMCTQGNSCQPL